MFKRLKKLFDGAMAFEFNDGYGIGYDHGHADAGELGATWADAVRKEERDALMPRVNYAEGWRYGALFAQQNTSIPMPDLVGEVPAMVTYYKGWRAGFTWYRESTKGMVLPS